MDVSDPFNNIHSPVGAAPGSLTLPASDAPTSATATSSLGSTVYGPDLTGGPNVSVNIDSTGTVMAFAGVSANSYVAYNFEITPSAAAPVGSLVFFGLTASGGVSGQTMTTVSGSAVEVANVNSSLSILDFSLNPSSPNYYLISNAYTNTGAGSTITCFSGGPTPGCSGTNQPWSVSNYYLPALVGDTIEIQIEASASIGTPGSFSAFVDPIITLDPSDPAGLGLEFSSGVLQPAPVAPVPVPAAAWLLLSGVCGLGAIAGRRRLA
jgi:hypothetical protein